MLDGIIRLLRWRGSKLFMLLLVVVLAACGGGVGTATPSATGAEGDVRAADAAHAVEEVGVELPSVAPVELGEGERLRVVATTNLVADAVARVGGDTVDLFTLIPQGADPHAYTATPQDLRQLSDADVIFVNGLGLEESLLPALESLDGDTPLVSVNVGVPTIEFGADGAEHASAEDEHGVDPHTWLDVMNVAIWADNVATILSGLDPAHADDYAAAAAAYRDELASLDTDLRTQMDSLPPVARKLVTDHEALGYFAAAYDFEIVGAVIPAYSTMAAASAQELAALQNLIQAEDAPAIFVGTTVNPNLADQIGQDLGIAVVPLYIGSLSEADGPAPTYAAMMHYNVGAIVDALQP